MTNLQLKPIDLDNDFDLCIANRLDTYIVSFGDNKHSDDGFDNFLSGYKERMAQRMMTDEWFYVHLWLTDNTNSRAPKIIGQFEYKSFSQLEGYGYIHLFYINKDYRGSGVATQALELVADSLVKAGCRGIILSVSSDNRRAIAFYKKMGFTYLASNEKHILSDFYIKDIATL